MVDQMVYLTVDQMEELRVALKVVWMVERKVLM